MIDLLCSPEQPHSVHRCLSNSALMINLAPATMTGCWSRARRGYQIWQQADFRLWGLRQLFRASKHFSGKLAKLGTVGLLRTILTPIRSVPLHACMISLIEKGVEFQVALQRSCLLPENFRTAIPCTQKCRRGIENQSSAEVSPGDQVPTKKRRIKLRAKLVAVWSGFAHLTFSPFNPPQPRHRNSALEV